MDWTTGKAGNRWHTPTNGGIMQSAQENIKRLAKRLGKLIAEQGPEISHGKLLNLISEVSNKGKNWHALVAEEKMEGQSTAFGALLAEQTLEAFNLSICLNGLYREGILSEAGGQPRYGFTYRSIELVFLSAGYALNDIGLPVGTTMYEAKGLPTQLSSAQTNNLLAALIALDAMLACFLADAERGQFMSGSPDDKRAAMRELFERARVQANLLLRAVEPIKRGVTLESAMDLAAARERKLA